MKLYRYYSWQGRAEEESEERNDKDVSIWRVDVGLTNS